MKFLALRNRLRIAVLFAVAAFFALPALAAKAPAKNYLERAMPHLVATMTKNFASFRGKRTEAGQFYDSYGLRVLSLPHAVISHAFAAPSQREYWSVHFLWYFPPTTSIVRASNLAEKYLAPSLKGFMAIGALDKRTGAVITTWTASNGRRVIATPFVQAASGSKPALVGVVVSVRHYITAHHRFALYASGMTPAQRKAFLGAFAREVVVGLKEAPTDFAAIRGRPNRSELGNEFGAYFDENYTTSFHLAQMYSNCGVDAVFFHPNQEKNDSHWMLRCDSPTVFGKSLTYDAASASITKVLPANYVQRMNRKTALATFMSAHRTRWDSPDGSISVILQDTADYVYSGGIIYSVSVFHFIPNQ